jgi:hypothetical protein
MANPASNAGGTGASGVRSAGLPSTRSSFSFTAGTNYAASSGSITNLTAIRRSVARTSRSAPTTYGGVFSETQALRIAYPGAELDSPAITRSGVS